MIRFILFGLFVSTNAFVFEDPDELSYYPTDPERYERLQIIEELQPRRKYVDENPVYEEELRMPGVKATKDDLYLCRAFPHETAKSIVSFKPLDENHVAHHILLFSCDAPGSDSLVWDCGEMSSQQSDSQYAQGPPCQTSSAPMYAVAHNAGNEGKKLPKDVGFPVGSNTNNQFVVLQVHYMKASEEDDFAGVKIGFTYGPQPKTAATLLLISGGQVASKTRESFEAACVISDDIEIHPISFRTHTHKWGEKVSGWVVRKDENGKDEWTLIGSRDPQKPQIFEKVQNTSLVIRQGDIIASRCVIKNSENHPIKIGGTGNDEMCNFYLMYWTEGPSLSQNLCYSQGPPTYHFSKSGLTNIPN